MHAVVQTSGAIEPTASKGSSMQDDDRFGIPSKSYDAVLFGQSDQHVSRVGLYVPTRSEVATMSVDTLRPILMDWMWESPTELIPSNEQIRQVKEILERRPDALALRNLIDECGAYMADQ